MSHTLFLIDGSAIAYKSHFAFIKNPLKNDQGFLTSAIYGFTTTLLRIIKKHQPDHLCVVLDAKEKTFRHEMYEPYKATREKMPDELQMQIPFIIDVVKALGINIIIQPGYEADDVIGTLAKQYTKRGIKTFIVSPDKDFMQLLDQNIYILNQKNGEDELYDTKAPIAKWGVKAEQVIDFLALMGDASDNVPGVKGVGEKTAAKLIEEFGSLKNLYDNIQSVKPQKLQEKLIEHKKDALLSKTLVTINTDVELKLNETELTIKPHDDRALEVLFKELGFFSLLKDIQPNTKPTGDKKYHIVRSLNDVHALIKQLTDTSAFCLDLETTSLNVFEANIVGLSICFKENESHYIALNQNFYNSTTVLELFKPILENPNIHKGGQNIKFDYEILINHGIKLQGIAFDTMVASYLLDSESRIHNLDALTLKHLKWKKTPIESLIKDQKQTINMNDVALDKIAHYACEDADASFTLNNHFTSLLQQSMLLDLYHNIEIPLIEVLASMELQGVCIDTEKLKVLQLEMEAKLKQLEITIHQEAKEAFNINSPKQLGVVLFEKLQIQKTAGTSKVKKTKTGYATDQETLEKYDHHPIVSMLLEYRTLSKLLSTYILTLPNLINSKTLRIHTNFNQTITATGRLSSTDPNLQNIPIRSVIGKKIRESFIASKPSWLIISADYSQIELRILAHLSQDPTLITTFKNDEDIHQKTASVIFDVPLNEVSTELRSRAKAINFGVLYGMGPMRLAKETGIDLAQAKQFIESYFRKYANIKNFLDAQIQFAKDHGFVQTITGRKRKIPDIYSSNPMLQGNAQRIATNTPIQGSAADLIKIAMIRIHHKMRQQSLKCHMLMQVHDELVFEVESGDLKQACQLIKHEMENAMDLNVPIRVDVGHASNWALAH